MTLSASYFFAIPKQICVAKEDCYPRGIVMKVIDHPQYDLKQISKYISEKREQNVRPEKDEKQAA